MNIHMRFFYSCEDTHTDTHKGQRKDTRKGRMRGEDAAVRQNLSHIFTHRNVCMHPCGHMLQCMLVYKTILHVSVHVWYTVCVFIRTWGHHPLQGACVFSWFPSQHCSFLTLHFLPPGWLTEVHKLQWTLHCLPLSWGSFGPNQNLQYHRVNWKLLKLPVNPAFTSRKKNLPPMESETHFLSFKKKNPP